MSQTYVFAPCPQASLPVKGINERFPVHRIYCVGQNYADHVVEMGGDPNRSYPFFFQKSPDCLVTEGRDFPYPSQTQDVHHEIELVVAIGKDGRNIAVEDALSHVYAYAVGIDMTRRDLQTIAKKAGRPWEVSKSFDHSAPCGELVRADEAGDLSSGHIWLNVNGETRQSGDLNQMIWKVGESIAYLSSLFDLKAGDLIFTGTPAGVGAVNKGDLVEGGIDKLGHVRCKVI
ncbi:fumarylacetoacetate hydrolase family protein [Brucellaceae bacterium C25G]